MSLVKLHVRDHATKEIIGTIVDIALDTQLEEVRKKIDVDFSLSLGDYNFVVFGTPLKRKQEKKYLATQCLSKSDQRNTYFCDLAILSEKPHSTASELSERNNNNRHVPAETRLSDREPVNLVGSRNAMSQIYSENEIKNATGFLEKERMVFGNNKAKEIMADSFFESWTFHEICGVVDVHWTLRKTELLRSYIQELDLNVSEKTGDDSQILKSVLRNSEKLEKAHFLTNNQYKKFCEEIAGSDGEKRRAELEGQFDEVFSKLKSTQCDVVRSIEQFSKVACEHMEIDSVVDHTCDNNKDNADQFDAADWPDLQVEEMDLLVASVKDDYEKEA